MQLKNFIASLTGVVIFFASAFAGNALTLYGVKTYDSLGGASGIYSVEATENAQPQPYWTDGDMLGTGGAVYTDEKLCILSYMDFFGNMFWWYLVCDVDAKQYEAITPENLGVRDAGSAQTYDPTTGIVYSICINADDFSSFTLSTMNIADGSKKPLAPISQQLCAMSCTAGGVLYGIGVDGNLYTVDKTTATLTLVGETGVSPAASNQSAVIDYDTNVMYWSAYTEEGGALYTVDLATGKASLLSKYDGNHQLVGLFIKQSTIKAGAPAPAKDFSVSFDKASTSGSVSFSLPALDTEGAALEGELTYEVKLNGNVLVSGRAAPGASVETDLVSPQEGYCTFVVTVSNSIGSSRPENATVWVGMDTPRKVEDCVLANDNGSLTLSWTLPETGVNGGYVDSEQTRYIIDRGPYDVNVTENHSGETYTEDFVQPGVNPVIFRVTPYIGDKIGEAVISNTVIVGDYLTPPFVEDLTDQFRSLVFTAIDSYKPTDEAGWVYDFTANVMKCEWPWSSDDHDAWFISAPVMFEAGKYYNVTANLRSEGIFNHDTGEYDDVYAGIFGMYLGAGATADAMQTTLIEPFSLVDKDFVDYESGSFTVPVTGTYNIGCHLSGKRSIYCAYLSRLEVELSQESVIDNIETGDSVSLKLSGNVLMIGNPTAAEVSVVTIDGRVIARTSDSEAAVELESGIYIVSSPGKSVKLAVK